MKTYYTNTRIPANMHGTHKPYKHRYTRAHARTHARTHAHTHAHARTRTRHTHTHCIRKRCRGVLVHLQYDLIDGGGVRLKIQGLVVMIAEIRELEYSMTLQGEEKELTFISLFFKPVISSFFTHAMDNRTQINNPFI